jgi:hypothetical protein
MDRWAWGTAPHGNRVPPLGYLQNVGGVVEELQREIQELILADLASSRDEAVPPQYQRMVERYYQVLSGEVRNE